MSKLNRSKRTIPTGQSMVRVLHPQFSPRLAIARASDYVEVPRLETYGTWPLSQMISEPSLIRLAVAAGQLPRDALELI